MFTYRIKHKKTVGTNRLKYKYEQTNVYTGTTFTCRIKYKSNKYLPIGSRINTSHVYF